MDLTFVLNSAFHSFPPSKTDWDIVQAIIEKQRTYNTYIIAWLVRTHDLMAKGWLYYSGKDQKSSPSYWQPVQKRFCNKNRIKAMLLPYYWSQMSAEMAFGGPFNKLLVSVVD